MQHARDRISREMLLVLERIERENRFWEQLFKWGFERVSDFALPHKDGESYTLYTVRHCEIPTIIFSFQINKAKTHIIYTTLPSYLFNSLPHNGTVISNTEVTLSDYLQTVSMASRIKIDSIFSYLFRSVI